MDARVGALAASQFGVFSRRQALATGASSRQIQYRLSTGRWDSPLPRVLRIVGASPSGRQDAMAGVLWAGPGAVVSHGAAAELWEIEGVRRPALEISVPAHRYPRSPSIIVHRGSRLDRADRTTFGTIPITTPLRTLIDVAGRLENDRLLAAMEDVFRRNLGAPDRLATRLASLRSSGRPGTGRLEELLRGRGNGGALESRLEARVWLLLQRSGVQLPSRQYWVALPGGRYRLDFAWPELKVGIECDSWQFHGGQAAFGKDRARYAELSTAEWRVIPITWHACTHESERVLRWLRTAVRRAA